MFCVNCQEETLNPKFCSRSCAVTFNNKLCSKRQLKSRNCKQCGTDVKRAHWRDNRMLCRSCANPLKDIKSMTIKEYAEHHGYQAKHRSWLYCKVRDLGRYWNRGIKFKICQNCGYDKHTQLCHIKPVSSFGVDTPLGEIHHPSNLVSLCPNCHWEFDNGLLKL